MRCQPAERSKTLIAAAPRQLPGTLGSPVATSTWFEELLGITISEYVHTVA